MSVRAPAAAARTSTTRGLEFGHHRGRVAHGLGQRRRALLDAAHACCRDGGDVLVRQHLRGAIGQSAARPTRSGRLARNRSKFDCTESMTGYCSLGTGPSCASRPRSRAGRCTAARSRPAATARPACPCEMGVCESMSAMTCTRSAARLSILMADHAAHFDAQVAHGAAAIQTRDAALEVDLVALCSRGHRRCPRTSRRTGRPSWRSSSTKAPTAV